MTTSEKEILRVLLIDDSLDDVELVTRELGFTYQIVWERVETEAALIVSLEDTWDVVLCDYKMPHLSAERALALIRDSNTCFGVPFIAISGVIDERIAIDLLRKGANDFISKDKIQRLSLTIERERMQSRERVGLRLKTEARIKESYDATLEAWGIALELRDIHTKGHTVRVADLSLRLALQMNVAHNQFINLYRGAYLHDIGKMGIPDAVLLKQDILTPEEMKIMRMHPTIAYNMLKNIPFLRAATDIPYCHHERWNGSGYPLGLMGSENPYPDGSGIPFLARLFSVIDVYDALTSDRPYRPSWGKSKAIAFLMAESGISFDPEIVKAFVEMVGRG